jgi:hypothetical protein
MDYYRRYTNIQAFLPEKNVRVFGKMMAYNSISNLNVLITGGAGFITFTEKSHRIKRLLR